MTYIRDFNVLLDAMMNDGTMGRPLESEPLNESHSFIPHHSDILRSRPLAIGVD